MSLIRFQRPDLWNSPALSQLSTLKDEINKIFEDPFFSGFGRESELFNGWSPAVDLYEDKDNLVVKAELPGLKKEDIEISIHEGNLTISGEFKRDEKAEGRVTRSERFVGRFQRTVSLPKSVEVNRVTASYKDGILTITLPKTEESKPRQIEVKVD